MTWEICRCEGGRGNPAAVINGDDVRAPVIDEDGDTAYGGWRMESGRSAIGMRVGEVCGVRKTIQKLHFLPFGNGIYLSRPLGARGVHHFFSLFRRFAVELRTSCTHFSRLVSPAFCNIHWYQSALHLFVNEPRQNQQTFRVPGPDPIRLL